VCVFLCVRTNVCFKHIPVCVCSCAYARTCVLNTYLCVCVLGADVDECVVGQQQQHCQQTCVNTFGSFRCSCPYGHTLAGDGRACVAECPAGYRKQPSTPIPGGNLSRKECVGRRHWDAVGLAEMNRMPQLLIRLVEHLSLLITLAEI
jgi:hypothetical protein